MDDEFDNFEQAADRMLQEAQATTYAAAVADATLTQLRRRYSRVAGAIRSFRVRRTRAIVHTDALGSSTVTPIGSDGPWVTIDIELDGDITWRTRARFLDNGQLRVGVMAMRRQHDKATVALGMSAHPDRLDDAYRQLASL